MGSTGNAAKFNKNNTNNNNDEEEEVGSSKNKNFEEETKPAAVKPKASAPTNIPAGGRPRHDSTGGSPRSPPLGRLKRRRTASLSTSPLSSFLFPQQGGARSPSPGSPATPTLVTSPGCQCPMSLDDVISAVNGVTNMALAHEIALDHNFKLEKFEPPQASLEKQVRDVMHQAFWDNLRDQLGQDPPLYDQAFVLLQEVRQQLLDLTLPHQLRLRQEISDKLDLDLVAQQAKHNVLNFTEYSNYVLEMMAKLCAPVRDEEIRKLKQITDVVEVFRGVAETLDLMRLDMANYTIQMVRPTIVRHIVEYERAKFKEFLATQNDGLELTRKWILEHVDRALADEVCQPSGNSKQTSGNAAQTSGNAAQTSGNAAQACGNAAQACGNAAQACGNAAQACGNTDQTCGNSQDKAGNEAPTSGNSETTAGNVAEASGNTARPSGESGNSRQQRAVARSLLKDPLAQRAFCNRALNRAFMALLQWPQDRLLPETVCVDRDRVLELRDRLHQVCTLAAVLLVSQTTASHAVPALSQAALAADLKRDLCPILDPAYTQAETLAALPNLTEQAVATLQKHLARTGGPPLAPATVESLRAQLGGLHDPSHRVTSLLTARCLAFLGGVLANANVRNLAVPAPFVVLQEEVARICGGFLRFTQHNRAVFGEFYFDMAENRLKNPPTEGDDVPPQEDDAPAPSDEEGKPVIRNKEASAVEKGASEGGEASAGDESALNAEKSPLNAEKLPLNAEKSPLNAEKLPLNAEKLPLNAEKLPVNSDNKPENDADKSGVRWDSLELD